MLIAKEKKDYNNPMAKKKEIYFGKGFKRIYFVLSAIWMVAWVIILFQDYTKWGAAMHNVIIPSLFWITAPIPLYFFIKWINRFYLFIVTDNDHSLCIIKCR